MEPNRNGFPFDGMGAIPRIPAIPGLAGFSSPKKQPESSNPPAAIAAVAPACDKPMARILIDPLAYLAVMENVFGVTAILFASPVAYCMTLSITRSLAVKFHETPRFCNTAGTLQG